MLKKLLRPHYMEESYVFSTVSKWSCNWKYLFLTAVGYSMVYGVLGLINFANNAFMIGGAYL